MTVCDRSLALAHFLHMCHDVTLGEVIVRQSATGHWPFLISWLIRLDATLGVGCHMTVCDKSLASAHFLAYAPRHDTWPRVSYESLCQLPDPDHFFAYVS